MGRNTLASTIVNILLWGLAATLLVFTAVRTQHFLSMTFPPDQAYMAWLGLAAFDGGVVVWFCFATYAAVGNVQAGVAYLMIFVDLLGVIVCSVADMLLTSDKNGLIGTIPPQLALTALYAVILVIVLNVTCTLIVHIFSPSGIMIRAEEKARNRIRMKTLEEINNRADSIAGDIANQLGQGWQDGMYRDMTGLLPQGKKKGIVVEEEPMGKS